ncbi:adenine nucleotide alpha hydrolase [Oceanimonas pelagia]|uniref:Adenine nucleotide alpha hydrolase n=1 Tax=Oceanimonas pelagia TaxID=3028314 RepID=A0AA50KPP9_9GAMM|nr:ATP-binding protein [Oceanimonas pelagia]WMC12106.1 adenine nucleotide alpha hydrolase [Oceanimonas pelagia]
MTHKRKLLMSWSSGKDSAWALQQLLQDPHFEVVGLFTTVNAAFDRVAMHGVRAELLRRQASTLGLPLDIITLPWPCTNADYQQRMGAFIARAKAQGIEAFGFGDLLLEDVRQYRENQLAGTGIEAVFPIWHTPTRDLPYTMFESGLRAVITCLDPKKVPVEFAGRELTAGLLAQLPEGTDPCGENGEFHTFVFDGPLFDGPVKIKTGEVVERDGFVFADVLPA